MSNSSPNRKPNSEESETPMSQRPSHRMHQPFGTSNSVLFGSQFAKDDSQNFSHRRSCVSSKATEMTGSGIFSDADNGATAHNRTSGYPSQQMDSLSNQTSFNSEKAVSHEKLTFVPEAVGKTNLHKADRQSKVLSGHDNSEAMPEIPPSLTSRECSRKLANEVQNQDSEQRSVNDIFKGRAHPNSADRQLSTNIILDGKAANRDYSRGSRQPPGGDSSISLG